MSSAEHRSAAEQSAARGDWASAIRHRVRAVARHLEETAVLHPVPGRTATELARDAGRAIPDLADELRRAAMAFNDVTYGELAGTEPTYRMIAELDDQLLTHSRGIPSDQGAPGLADGWVEVR
jgi:F420-0:gamma-glutamyl ligase-like protein